MFFFRKFTTKFSLNDNHVTILLLRKATFRQRNSSVWAKIMWRAKTQIIVTRARKWLCYSPNGTAVNYCEQLESLSCLFQSNLQNEEISKLLVKYPLETNLYVLKVLPDHLTVTPDHNIFFSKSKSWILNFFPPFVSLSFFFFLCHNN